MSILKFTILVTGAPGVTCSHMVKYGNDLKLSSIKIYIRIKVLSPGRSGCDFNGGIFKYILQICILGIQVYITLEWMSDDPLNGTSILCS